MMSGNSSSIREDSDTARVSYNRAHITADTCLRAKEIGHQGSGRRIVVRTISGKRGLD